jgi:hypothetical protein
MAISNSYVKLPEGTKIGIFEVTKPLPDGWSFEAGLKQHGRRKTAHFQNRTMWDPQCGEPLKTGSK